MYNQYGLPDPKLIEKLEPRNYKVEAYYLPDADGNIPEVYIYQNGNYIATCGIIQRYNEADAEKTEDDVKAYIEQAKYVARFDAMMKKEKIHKIGILRPEDKRIIEHTEAVPVVLPLQEQEDELAEYMNVDRYRQEGRKSL